jgi:hypothetical protein
MPGGKLLALLVSDALTRPTLRFAFAAFAVLLLHWPYALPC